MKQKKRELMSKKYLIGLLLFLIASSLQSATSIVQATFDHQLSEKDADFIDAHPCTTLLRLPLVIQKTIALVPIQYPSTDFSDDFLLLQKTLSDGYTVVL